MAKARLVAATALFGWVLWTAQGAAAPAPVNGVCDDSVVNGCSAGQLNDAVFPDGPAVHVWRCDGLNGGTNSEKCIRWVVVDGVCDESVRNGCSAGRPNDGAFPDRPDAYVWRCDGINVGQNSGQCVKFIPVNGVCDDTVRNGCSAGTSNDDAIPDNASSYLWRCDGLHGGTNSEKCHIRVEDVPIDGVCDDTVRNSCSAGTANDDAIPDNASSYLWRCDGLHGGANSEKCHIRIEDVPVDGVCDDTVRNGCTSGTANDAAFADNSTGYLWRCDGLHGGTNSDKCFIRIEDVPIDGVCDDSVRNGCSAGTANDAAIPDNRYSYLWRCDGQHGGADSEKCHIRVEDVPVDGVCDESARNSCSAGTANDAAVADTASQYQWRCDGLHGGSNSDTCSAAKPMVSCGGTWSPSPSTVCSGTSFTQTRTCNAGCNDGDCNESRAQNGTKPPQNCQWGSWGTWDFWEVCSETCGGGTRRMGRARSKIVTEACGGTCYGSATETRIRSCNTHNCPPPPCGTCACTADRTDGSDAGTCPISGASCIVEADNCPVDCGTCACTADRTDASDAGTCPISGASCTVEADNCPVDGGWGDWSSWSDCSVTCGGGTQTRSRECDSPSPANRGAQCEGSGSGSQPCNTQACPCSTPWRKVSETRVPFNIRQCGASCQYAGGASGGSLCSYYDVKFIRTCGSTTERKTERVSRNCGCSRACA